MSPREAIYQACLLRFRPIMMTTMAALLGGLPLALGTGTGSELRRPLGITIVGGLLVSQVLTLTPRRSSTCTWSGSARRLARLTREAPRPPSAGRRRPRRHEHLRRRSSAGRSPPRCWRRRSCWRASRRICQLPVAPLPRVDFPTISGQRALPGASPETMASAVATPLERRFGRIAGVTEMTSVSTLGATSITLQFDLDRDVDGGRARRAGGHQRRRRRAAAQPADPPQLPQGQPGRLADPDPRR